VDDGRGDAKEDRPGNDADGPDSHQEIARHIADDHRFRAAERGGDPANPGSHDSRERQGIGRPANPAVFSEATACRERSTGAAPTAIQTSGKQTE
jgi:hypothetical protein